MENDMVFVWIAVGVIIGMFIGLSLLTQDMVSTEAKDEVCRQLMGEGYEWYDGEHFTDSKFYCKNAITYDNTSLIVVID